MVFKKSVNSVEEWRNYFASLICNIPFKGPNNELYDMTNWVKGKEIRIFRMPRVDERVVTPVALGIEDLIKQIGLNFVIDYYGVDQSCIKQVEQALSKGGIDGNRLAEILGQETGRLPKYGGKPHADVFIVDVPFSTNPQDWGQSCFINGYLLLTLPGRRQISLDFIRKISKHEAGHLFGYAHHHDETRVKGYGVVDDCNMLWQASTSYTCEKCADAILYFWKGLELQKRMKFFK